MAPSAQPVSSCRPAAATADVSFTRSLPVHSYESSSHCFPLSCSLFSLLKCKYQVPFILLFFCYYCCYIVVILFFFFSSSRPVQQRLVCLSSVAVCKYKLQFTPLFNRETTEQMFHFYSLSLYVSLYTSLPLPPKMLS